MADTAALSVDAAAMCREYETQIMGLTRQSTMQTIVINQLREENDRLQAQILDAASKTALPQTAGVAPAVAG